MKSSPLSVSGFTLIELMIVLVIAGILAAIVMPGFTSLTQKQQVKNATFDLYSSLIVARSEAIKRNINVTITRVDDGNKVGWDIAAGAVTIRKQSALKGVDFEVTNEPTSGMPWVTYRRTGRTTATAAPIFLIDAYDKTTVHARCVKIELSGMPRIYKPVSGSC